MLIAITVGLAGALGATARYLLDGAVQDRTVGPWPFGTLVVNVTGSFTLGALTGLALHHNLPSEAKAILGAGFCGGLTTWSAVTWETVALAEGTSRRLAATYATASMATSTLAAAAGFALTSLR
jgi:CrcB protein